MSQFDVQRAAASSDVAASTPTTTRKDPYTSQLRGMDFAAGSALLAPPPADEAPVQLKAEPGEQQEGQSAAGVPAPSGAGSPLADSVRGPMEQSFGADFGGVRVHDGPSAEAMGGVRAAAQGSDITFAAGEYQPDSASGRELIGHELTHVVQQAAGRVQPMSQGKGGGANTDPGLEAEADQMGAMAAAGKPAHVAGASAVGSARRGEVAQFKNIFSRLRDKVDPTKRAERKQERADNRTAIDDAKATSAGGIADVAEAALETELATFVEQQLGKDAKLMQAMQDKGRESAIAKMGTRRTEVERSDAAEFVAMEARKNALSGKAKELAAAKVTSTVKAALLAAAEKGFEDTSGSGDEQAVVDKAKAKAAQLAKDAADTSSKLAKKELGKEIVRDKASLGADLESKTAGEVRTVDARKELSDRHGSDAEVKAALTGLLDAPLQAIDDKVLAFLKVKLGVAGVGLTRSKKLKDFRSKMKVAARDKAKADVQTEAAGETDELNEDATKRSHGRAKTSMTKALGKLADDGLAHAKTQAGPELALKLAASKAAWGAIRANDGRDGKAEAEAALVVALPAVKQSVLDEAKKWRDEIVKDQTNIDEAKDKVTEQVSSDEVGKKSVDASKGVTGDVDAVVGAIVPPNEQAVLATVSKNLKSEIGAMGAGWWRSDKVKTFRGNMKKAGRARAYKDVDKELTTPTLAETQGAGDATKAYMSVAGKDAAYDKAKGSVNAQMKEFARNGAAQALSEAKTTDALSKIARKAAYSGFRKPGEGDPKEAAESAASLAVSAGLAKVIEDAMVKAEAWKAKLFLDETINEDDGTGTGNVVEVDTKDKVKSKVKADGVGVKSVKQALQANTTAEGMAAVGRLADLAAPNRGDSAKLEVELRIPVPNSPAFVKLHVVAEAERGVTTRKNGAPPGSVDAKSLKVGAQFNVGGGVDLWGLRLDGTIGFFVRGQAMDTQKTFQALNYGAYRSACRVNDGMADWWGGTSKSKSKDPSGTMPGTGDGGHKKGATERAELWAAMVEENVFMRENPHYIANYQFDANGDYQNSRDKKRKVDQKRIPDEAAFVDIGGSLNAKGKLKAQVFEGEASARGELYSHYDGDTIKRSIKKAQTKSGSGTDIGLAKGGSNETEAKERRKAIKPKTGGGLTIETKLACKILEQHVEFGVKGEFGTAGWGVEIAAGLKLDMGGDPTAFEKIANGIVSSGASGLRSLIGIYQNTQQTGGEQANKGIGSLLDAGSDAENIIDTATGGMLTTALGKAYQVSASKSDQVNETVSNKFDEVTGQDNELSANQEERGGAGSEVMLQVVIAIGPGTCNLQIKQVKVRKFAADVGSAALEVSIEKQKRLAQLGMVDGKFHAEGLGFGTTRK